VKTKPTESVRTTGLCYKALWFSISTTSNDDYKLIADTVEIRERWVSDIKEAIEQCTQNYWKNKFDNDISTFLNLPSVSTPTLNKWEEELDPPDSGKPESTVTSPK
jgi:hypothetical protein